MLEFYVALGFEITYQQTKPNIYACVKRGAIDLHFFSMKGYQPKHSYSTCFVLVPDLAGLHQAFSSGLRAHYGKLPVAGIPRISKLNNSNADKQLRFNVIDPGGNWVRFAQKGEPPVWEDYRQAIKQAGLTLTLEPILKWDFYQAVESTDHVLTIQTGDQALWANVLLTLGCRTD